MPPLLFPLLTLSQRNWLSFIQRQSLINQLTLFPGIMPFSFLGGPLELYHMIAGLVFLDDKSAGIVSLDDKIVF